MNQNDLINKKEKEIEELKKDMKKEEKRDIYSGNLVRMDSKLKILESEVTSLIEMNKLWLDRIDNLDIELFLEDVVDVKTGKKVEIPKEVLDLWNIYWQHIKEKLKSGDKNGTI